MSSPPRYTVIVAVHRFRAREPVLVSLRETAPDGLQILVATGQHPARQRNAALARAQGEIIVFLDNDCRVEPDFWTALEADFARPEIEVVGGPALLRREAEGPEKIFHALLTHPLVVGPIAARYAPRGHFRPATQTELILCNLAARHAIFNKTGHLSTELYPNEENEWLDRAQAAGVSIHYDPDLRVYRPQRSTWGAMAFMLLRYGMGRSRQWQVSGWRPTVHQILPIILLPPAGLLVFGPRFLTVFFLGWMALAVIIGWTCRGALTFGQRIVAGLVAPLIPLLYAVGQVVGWFALILPVAGKEHTIELFDEKGEQIP